MNALRAAILRGARAAHGAGGTVRGTRRGDGLVFSQLRGYVEGDDPRRIDHAATARAGSLQTRVFLEETTLVLAALVDESGSMSVGRRRPLTASAFEALRAWFGALEGEDRAARIVDARVLRDRRAAALARATLPFRFGQALAIAGRALPRGSSLLAITDGFELPDDEYLWSVARRFDATVLLARDPWRDDLPLRGFVRLRDAESGRTRTHVHRRPRARTLHRRVARPRSGAACALSPRGLARRDARGGRRRRLPASSLRGGEVTVTQPLWLLAGIALAALFVVVALRAAQRGAAAALTYSDLAFFETATRRRLDPALILLVAAALGIAAIGAALAGIRVVARLPVHGGAVVLCVDTSGSMRSTDIAPSRSDAAAAAVRAFVDDAPAGTRIAIVAFSSGAGIVQPLTGDKETLRAAIAQIPPPNGGTAIGDALLTAARALPAGGKRAIVLVTDGVNNLGSDPLEAAREIGAAGIEVDTVGIGTNDSGTLVPGTDQAASIDEEALRTIAGSAHGVYARVADAGALRARLAALARSTTMQRQRIDASLPLALFGGGIAILALAGGTLAGRFP